MKNRRKLLAFSSAYFHPFFEEISLSSLDGWHVREVGDARSYVKILNSILFLSESAEGLFVALFEVDIRLK